MLSEKLCSEMDVPREGESIFKSKKADYRIDPETGCWIWIKGLTPNGYPHSYAHRLYYERANNVKVPKGWHTHHLCHVRACVNPAHLRAIDPGAHLTHHLRQRSSLTEADVVEIRKSTLTARELGPMYGVKPEVIENIFLVRDWIGVGPAIKPIRYCKLCGAEVPQSRRRHAVYCSVAHRLEWNARADSERRKAKTRARAA